MKYTTDKHDNKVSFEDLCHLIYQGFGQDAVLAFCTSINWHLWYWCEPCEAESPVSDNPSVRTACLVCGSTI